MTGRRLVIRAHGGNVAGAGHLMRCLALAEAWRALGGRVTFVIMDGLSTLEARLRSVADLVRIDAPPGTAADAAATRSVVLASEAVALVVDGYVFDEAYLAALGGPAPIVLIDDEPRCERYPVELLVNQNLHASPADYATVAPGARLLLGPRYALIRRELRTAKRTSAEPGRAVRVLVTLGGADPANVTRTAIRALGALGDADLEVRVLVGPLNPRAAELLGVARGAGGHVEVLHRPPDVAGLMAWADLAVSAAGSTTWELLHIGVPLALVTLADNQRAIAESVGRAGLALDLGWHADVTPESIGDAVKALASDANRRQRMAEQGRRLVDGQGAERVAAEIETLVSCAGAGR